MEAKKKFSDFGIKPVLKGMVGDKIKIGKILNKEIEVVDFRIDDSKYGTGGSKCLCIQIKLDGVDRIVFTGSKVLMETIEQIPKSTGFPFTTTIVEENERYEFT